MPTILRSTECLSAPPPLATMATKVQKVMTQPITLIFRFLQTVRFVWRYSISCLVSRAVANVQFLIARLCAMSKPRTNLWSYTHTIIALKISFGHCLRLSSHAFICTQTPHLFIFFDFIFFSGFVCHFSHPQKSRIQVMLFGNVDMRIEGRLIVRCWHCGPSNLSLSQSAAFVYHFVVYLSLPHTLSPHSLYLSLTLSLTVFLTHSLPLSLSISPSLSVSICPFLPSHFMRLLSNTFRLISLSCHTIAVLTFASLSPSFHHFLSSRLKTHSPRQGFDEYMNIVLEDAEEISLKRKSRKSLGAHPSFFSLSRFLFSKHNLVLTLPFVSMRPFCPSAHCQAGRCSRATISR